MDPKHGTDEDDNQRDRFMMNKTPSQDMFYKNGRMQSHDSLKRSKNKSEERQSSKMNSNQLRQNHSQSLKTQENQVTDDGQAAMPPAFDKKIMQQHRNSADSEFNNKGHRKLRPAQKGNG